jgi:tetraacyldisaccharide 4'-kinase
VKSLDQYWYSQNIFAWSLLPLSWLFRILSIIRKRLYANGFLTSTRLNVPVVVVGNISAGGTGKTPLLIALCELLTASGYRPGVVSRGYASSLRGEALVTDRSTAALVGDEPLLIARRTVCPVAVGRRRPEAAKLLLKNYDCDILLSDDGLQHYALQRDMEIAVVDAARLHGNGYYLPAGPLREPIRRLDSVDMVVYNGACEAKHRFDLEFLTTVNVATGTEAELKTFSGQTVHAVAGIGHPQRFFDQLKNEGLKVIPHAFSDHHVYSMGDLVFDDSLPVLMTEKDAVKCAQLQLSTLWAVPVVARLSSQLKHDFLERVSRLVAKSDIT